MSEEQTIVNERVLTDLASFNSYGVVTLLNGQEVNVQLTMRHGMTAENMANDFNQYIEFLNTATTVADIKFWDGKRKGDEKSAPVSQPGSGWTWQKDPEGNLVQEKGKNVLLVTSGSPPEKVPCPQHAGKNLYLKSNDKGKWYSHKSDSGYCNANLRFAPKDNVDEAFPAFE